MALKEARKIVVAQTRAVKITVGNCNLYSKELKTIDDRIISYCKKAEESSVNSILKRIEISKINSVNSGNINTRILRDNGFETLYDIHGVSAYRLSMIRGIGDVTANRIVSAANRFYDSAEDQRCINLCSNELDSLSRNIIYRIYLKKVCSEKWSYAVQLLNEYDDKVKKYLKLANRVSFLRFMLKNEEKKKNAINECDECFSQIEPFIRDISQLSKELSKLYTQCGKDYLNDFSNNRDDYIKIISLLNRGHVSIKYDGGFTSRMSEKEYDKWLEKNYGETRFKSDVKSTDYYEYLPVIQRSSEWYTLRSDKITGTAASQIKNYDVDEVLRTKAIDDGDGPETEAMKRGMLLESRGLSILENRLNRKLCRNGVIISKLYPKAMYSPDGMILNDDMTIGAIVEHKAFSEKHHMKCIQGKIDSSILDQINFGMFVTHTSVAVLVFYNPDVEDAEKRFVHFVMKADPQRQKIFKDRFKNYSKPVDEVTSLTRSQTNALNLLRSGENAIICGKAGTGKTYLINYFKKMAIEDGKKVVVCAPTGIAASLSDGVTIHKAFSIGYGELVDYKNIKNNQRKPKDYIYEADIIIIDEISMCRVDIFDYAISCIREIERFTGIKKQIVLCGDFYQLPPVVRKDELDLLRKKYNKEIDGYCFEGSQWEKLNIKKCMLTEIKRQNDSEYIKNLNLLRSGDPSCLQFFNKKVVDANSDDKTIRLMPTNAKVDKVNNSFIDSLPGKEIVYEMEIEGSVSVSTIIQEEHLRIKNGERVICLSNYPGHYYNGKTGRVSSFTSESVAVTWDDGKTDELCYETTEVKEPIYRSGTFKHKIIGQYSQIPLKPAYAITIHKSQGLTLEGCIIDPHTFSDGQLYTAVSRCSNPDKLFFTNPITTDDIKVSKRVADFYESD